MELSVVIVSWNCREELRTCLSSLASGLGSLSHEIIVVDNASSDGTSGMVKEEFPQVRLVSNSGNSGFACANNQGLDLAAGEYLLLLNPDTVLTPGTAEGLLEFMKVEPRAGVVGPAFSSGAGTQASIRPGIYRFPGVKDELFLDTVLADLSAGLHRLPGLSGHAPEGAGGGPVESDWVSGACMLVRRQAMAENGVMDPRFFLYMEELEWCYRIKRIGGWKIFILPHLSIMHSGGVSSGKKRAGEISAIYYESRYKFFEKHWPGALVAVIRTGKVILLGISLLWYMLEKLAAPGERAEAEAKIVTCRAAITVLLRGRKGMPEKI
ncbi:MAG: hypothetical protein AUJ51_04950 [Elusimicrobia bacterium CG1_02_56_21]|nr:MAG: hypothetical protein AUJ51_04950 [Elusimicrobia bacterium CG1_02_56_21]